MSAAGDSVGAIARRVREDPGGCVAVAEEALERAGRCDLNAFVRLDRDGALARARGLQAAVGEGRAPPLAGVPYAVKDIFNVRGQETTCGSRILEGYVSPYDATAVARADEAGLVLVGRTNMDEFAMGSSGENSHFGCTLNPWDRGRVPGGSSSGSAAAVAAGVVPAAIGTDTGGSVRQPAAFCGICGIKPTYGRVSRYGMVAFASSLDQGGVFARSAEDLARVTSAIMGHDPRDSTSLAGGPEDLGRDLDREIGGMAVGLPDEFFGEGLSPDVRSAVDAAVGVLDGLGARVVRLAMPNLKYSIPVYYVIACSEASSNLSRYDGVRYGYRTPSFDNLADMYERTRAEGFGREVKRRVLIGTYMLSYGYYDDYYRHAQKVRHLIADDYRTALGQCDVVLGPTTPTTAFAIGEKVSDPVQMYLNDIYTASVNLAGLPGLSVPCGFDGAGLPIGMQLVGAARSEATLLRFAHQYQSRTDWHTRRPPGHA